MVGGGSFEEVPYLQHSPPSQISGALLSFLRAIITSQDIFSHIFVMC